VERDTLAAMGQQGAQGLELAVVPTFATQWLVPRLKAFQQLHPEVTVHLTNRTRPFLFAEPASTPPSTSAMASGPAPRRTT